uniref:nuclear factor of activated T-cells 5-like isoform X2 n=1 Tax=Myxine glutinosa TaxID=7769 RepID=UPI00358F7839
MPSDFIPLLGPDMDLNSPESLYSRGSVYDLLPKELQLPSSLRSGLAPAAESRDVEAERVSGNMAVPSADVPCIGGAQGNTPLQHPVQAPSPVAKCPTTIAAIVSTPGAASVAGVSSLSTVSGIFGNEQVCTAASQTPEAASSPITGLPMAQKRRQEMHSPSCSVSLIPLPPPKDLLEDASFMSCDEVVVTGCGEPSSDPMSELSAGLWTEDSLSNLSTQSGGSPSSPDALQAQCKVRRVSARASAHASSCHGPPDDSDGDTLLSSSLDDGGGLLCSVHHNPSSFALVVPGSPASPSATPTDSGTLEMCAKPTLTISPSLASQHPNRAEGTHLRILVQPEGQHRARYLTEGSRGSVKDCTQQSFPTVKLEGYNQPVVLQVFVGSDSGRVRPHGFYQACRVTGRNTTPCTELDIEGTTVIEVPLDPANDMALAVDCVGILKLRNADVEARVGPIRAKKKSTRVRLVFRVNLAQPDGSLLTLQAPSTPILCTQPAGTPEILKKSLLSCSAHGGEELFLIGKNFLRGLKVIFQESNPDGTVMWNAEAEIDTEYFHQNHVIVKVPPYHDVGIVAPVTVGIIVSSSAGHSHESQAFTYTPVPATHCTSSVNVKSEEMADSTCAFEETTKEGAHLLLLPKLDDPSIMDVSTSLPLTVGHGGDHNLGPSFTEPAGIEISYEESPKEQMEKSSAKQFSLSSTSWMKPEGLESCTTTAFSLLEHQEQQHPAPPSQQLQIKDQKLHLPSLEVQMQPISSASQQQQQHEVTQVTTHLQQPDASLLQTQQLLQEQFLQQNISSFQPQQQKQHPLPPLSTRQEHQLQHISVLQTEHQQLQQTDTNLLQPQQNVQQEEFIQLPPHNLQQHDSQLQNLQQQDVVQLHSQQQHIQRQDITSMQSQHLQQHDIDKLQSQQKQNLTQLQSQHLQQKDMVPIQSQQQHVQQDVASLQSRQQQNVTPLQSEQDLVQLLQSQPLHVQHHEVQLSQTELQQPQMHQLEPSLCLSQQQGQLHCQQVEQQRQPIVEQQQNHYLHAQMMRAPQQLQFKQQENRSSQTKQCILSQMHPPDNHSHQWEQQQPVQPFGGSGFLLRMQHPNTGNEMSSTNQLQATTEIPFPGNHNPSTMPLPVPSLTLDTGTNQNGCSGNQPSSMTLLQEVGLPVFGLHTAEDEKMEECCGQERVSGTDVMRSTRDGSIKSTPQQTVVDAPQPGGDMCAEDLETVNMVIEMQQALEEAHSQQSDMATRHAPATFQLPEAMNMQTSIGTKTMNQTLKGNAFTMLVSDPGPPVISEPGEPCGSEPQASFFPSDADQNDETPLKVSELHSPSSSMHAEEVLHILGNSQSQYDIMSTLPQSVPPTTTCLHTASEVVVSAPADGHVEDVVKLQTVDAGQQPMLFDISQLDQSTLGSLSLTTNSNTNIRYPAVFSQSKTIDDTFQTIKQLKVPIQSQSKKPLTCPQMLHFTSTGVMQTESPEPEAMQLSNSMKLPTSVGMMQQFTPFVSTLQAPLAVSSMVGRAQATVVSSVTKAAMATSSGTFQDTTAKLGTVDSLPSQQATLLLPPGALLSTASSLSPQIQLAPISSQPILSVLPTQALLAPQIVHCSPNPTISQVPASPARPVIMTLSSGANGQCVSMCEIPSAVPGPVANVMTTSSGISVAGMAGGFIQTHLIQTPLVVSNLLSACPYPVQNVPSQSQPDLLLLIRLNNVAQNQAVNLERHLQSCLNTSVTTMASNIAPDTCSASTSQPGMSTCFPNLSTDQNIHKVEQLFGGVHEVSNIHNDPDARIDKEWSKTEREGRKP